MFLCSQLSLTCLFRSELLDARMLSTGKSRWCLWAPLVLLALVSGVPTKAQDMGKCFPPPLLLPLISDLHPSPTCPQVICPDLYPSSLSSPLLVSPHSSVSALVYFHIISLFDVQAHSPQITRSRPHHFTQVSCQITLMSEGCYACTCNGSASNCGRAANAQCSRRLCLDTLTHYSSFNKSESNQTKGCNSVFFRGTTSAC